MTQQELNMMMNTNEMIELRKRNAERMLTVREQLGSKWLFHPENPGNQIKRIVPSSVLTHKE